MRILYIHQHFATPTDSIGTRSYEFSKRLIAAGHSVTMLCGDTANSGNSSSSTDRVVRYDVDGINVIKIREPYSNNMGFLTRIYSFARFALTASKIAKKEQVDLVFATSTPLTAGIPGMISARSNRAPFVFEVRDLWPELPISMGEIRNTVLIYALRKLEHLLYDKANSIVALAPGIEKGISNHTGSSKNISVIPNSSDIDLIKPSNSPLDKPEMAENSDLKIVYCGHHGKANGLDAAINAAKVLAQKGVSGVKFVMIGSGSEKEKLIETCIESQLESYFSWIDPISKAELAKILPRMDVGFMPLLNVPAFHYGTSPNKFFDYLSAGLPILNNYPGWVADLINENKCGITAKPDDSSELANKIVWLKTNQIYLNEMGKASRMLAESKFSRDKLGELFVSHLELTYENSKIN